MTAINVLLMSREADKKALTAVKEKLDGHRQIFESGEAAFETAVEISQIEGMTLPILVAGHGDVQSLESLPDWAAGRVGVSLLGVKKEKTTGARALVIYPCPSVSEYDADAAGHDWLDKIATKETSHVAFRPLRGVDDEAGTLEELTQAAQRMPVTVADYAEIHRTSGGLDTKAFDSVWSTLRTMLLKEYPVLKQALPTKAEVINAIRSKQYATSEYPDLETQNLFTFIANAVIQFCAGAKDEKTGEAAPIDSDEVQDWLDGRDKLVIQAKERQALTTTLDLKQLGA